MYTIYCDMDGVLVDFVKGYHELTGVDVSKNNSLLWEPINERGAEWWATLDWMRDGKVLWNYIKKYKPYILSAPSRSKSSEIGKKAWCQINIPGQYKELLLYPKHEKQRFAGKNKILIDDLEKTINEWNAKGGIGILHTSAISTIRELKKLGL